MRVDKDQGQGCESGIIVEVEENDEENDGSWMGWDGWGGKESWRYETRRDEMR